MQDRTYQFAEFRLSLADGYLRSGTVSVRLQDKPLQLLVTLLDNPGRLVTRQQLRERMWDSRTVVGYEQGINVAIKKVRDALGDSADTPRFIETVARKGYRFLLPVEIIASPDGAPGVAELISADAGDPVIPSKPADADRSGPGRHTPAHQQLLAAMIALVIGVGIVCTLGFYDYRTKVSVRQDPPIHSLAVLPLQDLSPDAGQEYFADGVTEEFITSLAQTLPLRVISRSSVMQYKNADKPVAQIARELGVDAIVRGSVARSGNRVTVEVQLMDAGDGRYLWTKKFDRPLEDILNLGVEVSQAIASQVHSAQSPQYLILSNKGRVDPQAFDLCLLGRYHLNKRTPADLAKAKGYFQEAASRDPRYAPAYSGLAIIYALQPFHATISFEDGLAEGEEAARRALELDRDSAEAHEALGFIRLIGPRWTLAGPEFRRALEIDPNYALAHHHYAYYLFFDNHHDEALDEIALSRKLDPLSASTHADEGHFLYATRHFDEAKVRLQRAIELDPGGGQPHETLALIELETGHPQEAQREARVGLALDPNGPRTMGEAGYVFAATGDTVRARQLLIMLKELWRRDAVPVALPAMVEIGLGERDEAIALLQQGMERTPGPGPRAFAQWHAFDALAGNARYQALSFGPSSQPDGDRSQVPRQPPAPRQTDDPAAQHLVD